MLKMFASYHIFFAVVWRKLICLSLTNYIYMKHRFLKHLCIVFLASVLPNKSRVRKSGFWFVPISLHRWHAVINYQFEKWWCIHYHSICWICKVSFLTHHQKVLYSIMCLLYLIYKQLHDEFSQSSVWML